MLGILQQHPLASYPKNLQVQFVVGFQDGPAEYPANKNMFLQIAQRLLIFLYPKLKRMRSFLLFTLYICAWLELNLLPLIPTNLCFFFLDEDGANLVSFDTPVETVIVNNGIFS